jgi:hypothetical protein
MIPSLLSPQITVRALENDPDSDPSSGLDLIALASMSVYSMYHYWYDIHHRAVEMILVPRSV